MKNLKVSENLAISESGFLFLTTTGETFTTNEIGKKIIQMLQMGKVEDEIIKFITNNYNVDSNTFEKDLSDFITQLNQFNLIQN